MYFTINRHTPLTKSKFHVRDETGTVVVNPTGANIHAEADEWKNQEGIQENSASSPMTEFMFTVINKLSSSDRRVSELSPPTSGVT
ncbi:MAG: hypothetical protein J07HQW1_00710 [Haloquadratum walsbyi J07HQW1]|jgi:hypothetical protein|uniref:Uncharacterized protein n=1 Tax=Haloquadratum walsbyi J07HQW1 TaxID=1238424 RepID=U1N2U4_9EURY|nr:MAG: hypothetical protein J07HQW1_00710 [Haloquadratum walsbyi J07HQW1]